MLAQSWPEEVSLVVNPGDPVELALPGHDFRALAAGAEPGGEEAVPGGTTVLVGDPAVDPEEVLHAAAADQAADAESLQRDIADAATAAGAEAVSILMLEPAASGNAVADYMVQRTRPFYERD